jgi:hypothetical protein
MHTLKPVWFRRLHTPTLKPSIDLPERFRGFENPLSRTKLRSYTYPLPRDQKPLRALFISAKENLEDGKPFGETGFFGGFPDSNGLVLWAF